MVINSTNINKTTSHWTQKRPRHILMEIQLLGLANHKNVSMSYQLMGSKPSLDICICNDNSNTNKQ